VFPHNPNARNFAARNQSFCRRCWSPDSHLPLTNQTWLFCRFAIKG